MGVVVVYTTPVDNSGNLVSEVLGDGVDQGTPYTQGSQGLGFGRDVPFLSS